MLLNLTLWAFNCKDLTFSLGLAMHSDNPVDSPQFAPEQRQMLFYRQAQAAVCHHHLPLTHLLNINVLKLQNGKNKGTKRG